MIEKSTPTKTTPRSFINVLRNLQAALDHFGDLARDVLPEGRRSEEVDIHGLIRQLAPFAHPLSGGREVRRRDGGTRRVRGWTLPPEVYALTSAVGKEMAKKKKTGLKLLHAAIYAGDASSVDWLLRAGFPPGEYAGGRPAMGFAYYDDRPRAVRLLWQHGASHEHTFRDSPSLPSKLRGSTQFHRLLERGSTGLDLNDPDHVKRLRHRCEVARFFAATYEHPMARNASGLSAFDLAPRGDQVAEVARAELAAREAAELETSLPKSHSSKSVPRI